MFKTSLGKLAIGVVALSSAAVAHAAEGVMNKLKPSAITLEGLPLGAHGDSWKTTEFFHAQRMYNVGVALEGSTLFDVGPVKFKFSPEFSWLGVEATSAATAELRNEQAKNETSSSDSGISAQKLTAIPVSFDSAKKATLESSATVSGGFVQPFAVTVDHNFTYRLKGLLKVGAGLVVPKNAWHAPYGASYVQVGGSYRMQPNLSLELGGKYIYTMNQAAKNISGLNVGLKYYVI